MPSINGNDTALLVDEWRRSSFIVMCIFIRCFIESYGCRRQLGPSGGSLDHDHRCWTWLNYMKKWLGIYFEKTASHEKTSNGKVKRIKRNNGIVD